MGNLCILLPREFDLLHLLARQPGQALSRDWIFEEVWGYDSELGMRRCAVCVRRVRCKIEEDPDILAIFTRCAVMGTSSQKNTLSGDENRIEIGSNTNWNAIEI